MITNKKHKYLIKLRNITIVLVIVIVTSSIVFNLVTSISPPKIDNMEVLDLEREIYDSNYFIVGNSWLRKNAFGLWEMYLEGNPFEIGVINGKLTKELIKQQEDSFVDQINTLVPSKGYLRFLKYFIAWFNRDMHKYVPPEYIEEIYGVSFSAADNYEYIGTKYERMLNYHGAHDIGHALQNLALVGCTSFGANLGFNDSSFIIGRNFDFYINDEFAENKIVAFVKPDNGHEFAYVTWASMIGVVSGINKKGLTVTINAAKSDMPTKAKMPISLLAREILQYAGNINEAIAIAKKREIFVSESILVGSAEDNNAVIIEKSPGGLDVYYPKEDLLICSNHFQSDKFKNEPNNLEYIEQSATAYRQNRALELLDNNDTTTYEDAASMLRDYNGMGNKSIGIGNEKAMAQFISHHSIIFQPLKHDFWVSTTNYQFGAFLNYNLDTVFSKIELSDKGEIIYDSVRTINADTLTINNELASINKFRKLKKVLIDNLNNGTDIKNKDKFINEFISVNPDYYQGYVLAANYFYDIKDYDRALDYYKLSLSKEFENTTAADNVKNKITELESKVR